MATTTETNDSSSTYHRKDTPKSLSELLTDARDLFDDSDEIGEMLGEVAGVIDAGNGGTLTARDSYYLKEAQVSLLSLYERVVEIAEMVVGKAEPEDVEDDAPTN